MFAVSWGKTLWLLAGGFMFVDGLVDFVRHEELPFWDRVDSIVRMVFGLAIAVSAYER